MLSVFACVKLDDSPRADTLADFLVLIGFEMESNKSDRLDVETKLLAAQLSASFPLSVRRFSKVALSAPLS